MLPTKPRGAGGRVINDPCGCQHWEHMWLRLCPQHQAEVDARHKRAMEDYRADQQAKKGDKEPAQAPSQGVPAAGSESDPAAS